MIPADWALAGLLAQLLGALMAHTHMPAGQHGRIPVIVEADDAQSFLHVLITLMLHNIELL